MGETVKTGILGGSFDPVHLGHLSLAQSALDFFLLDQVLFIPTHQSPHKSAGQASPTARWEMLQHALSGKPQFRLDNIELQKKEVTYSIETLKAIHARSCKEDLYLILGADTFEQIHTWKDAKELMGYANFIIGTRPGFSWGTSKDLTQKIPLLTLGAMIPCKTSPHSIGFKNNKTGKTVTFFECPLLDISSTRIRENVQRGISVKKMLPSEVEQYIIHERLYL